MLVISPRLGERVYIGDEIIVEVISVDRGGVRLGVTAPRSLDIDREQIHRRKLLERTAAFMRRSS